MWEKKHKFFLFNIFLVFCCDCKYLLFYDYNFKLDMLIFGVAQFMENNKKYLLSSFW